MPIYIYEILHPETREPHFIGKTRSPERVLSPTRLRRNPALAQWVEQFRAQGLEPRVKVVDKCDATNIQEREEYWIQSNAFFTAANAGLIPPF